MTVLSAFTSGAKDVNAPYVGSNNTNAPLTASMSSALTECVFYVHDQTFFYL